MKLSTVNTLIATLIVFHSVSGASLPQDLCKDVRLDTNNGPFSKIPLFDQKKFDSQEDSPSSSFNGSNLSASGENLCYAVAACQLIDANRYENGNSLNQLCSPVSLALNHKVHYPSIPNNKLKGTGLDKRDENASVVGPGNSLLAMMSNSGKPICDQRWLEKYASLFSGGDSQEISNDPNGSSVRSFFAATFQQINQVASLEASLSEKEKILNSYFKCRTDAGVSNLKDILEAAQMALKAADPVPRAQIFLSELCKENSFITSIPQPIFFEGKDETLDKPLNDAAWAAKDDSERNKIINQIKSERANRRIKKISSLLSGSPPKPVGIGYVHEMLNWKNLGGWADHTSVIIGQRWNGHSCEFLLRDSYGGKNCSKALYPCDNGSFWVPQEALEAATSSIYWIP